MRSDLYDDPAVVEIMALTGLDEFAVVGRLHAIWTWADGASRDGHVRSVTPSSLVLFLERKIACAGFVAAMCQVGWMRIGSDRITFPKFERHMSKSAKNRALATERQSRKRRDDVSRTPRDKSVTREEKSREEKSSTPSLRSGDARARALKRRPPEVLLDDDRLREAREIGLTAEEVEREWAKMGDHQYAKARSDWPAAWRNWCRGTVERRKPERPPPPDEAARFGRSRAPAEARQNIPSAEETSARLRAEDEERRRAELREQARRAQGAA